MLFPTQVPLTLRAEADQIFWHLMDQQLENTAKRFFFKDLQYKTNSFAHYTTTNVSKGRGQCVAHEHQ